MKKIFPAIVLILSAPFVARAQYVPIGTQAPDGFGLAQDANGLYGVIFNLLLLVTQVIAVLAILMIVISGIIYMTSAGDENRASSAKRALTFAVTGLVIALLAWTIVYIILNAFGIAA